MNLTNIIIACIGAGMGIVGFFLYRNINKKLKGAKSQPSKKNKILKSVFACISILGAWFFVIEALAIFFGGRYEKKEFTVELFAERLDFFGLNISTTILFTWIIIAVVLVLALIVRIFFIPTFKDKPKGLQNVLEILVEQISKYTDSKVEGLGDNLGAYIFTIALYMIFCAATELFGVRSPTADITLTLSMALMTFVLINFYGIKRKGVLGRIKGLSSPTPLVFPIRVICDLAIPVSMACRLFGNMLGGLIVMDLLYMALGNVAIGIPSVIGLYFNVFHPLIQAFIFVTLTLTFINEAVED